MRARSRQSCHLYTTEHSRKNTSWRIQNGQRRASLLTQSWLRAFKVTLASKSGCSLRFDWQEILPCETNRRHVRRRHPHGRKGFLHTRWRLTETSAPFDMINTHLFHDVDNTVAMAETPSCYATNRQVQPKRASLHHRHHTRAHICDPSEQAVICD